MLQKHGIFFLKWQHEAPLRNKAQLNPKRSYPPKSELKANKITELQGQDDRLLITQT